MSLALGAGEALETRIAFDVLGERMEGGGVDAEDLQCQQLALMRGDAEDVAPPCRWRWGKSMVSMVSLVMNL